MTSISPSYQKCAAENGICNYNKTDSIAFAATDGTGSVYYRNSTNPEQCNVTTFGDPSVGHPKQCYSMQVPSNITYSNGLPVGFAVCSGENGICTPPNSGRPADILYGANGSYVYANATSTPCNSTVFGDPAPGIEKYCYWRNSSPSNNIVPTPTNIIIPTPINLPIIPQKAPSPIVPTVPTIPSCYQSPILPISPVPQPLVPSPTPSAKLSNNVIIIIVVFVVLIIVILIVAALVWRRRRVTR